MAICAKENTEQAFELNGCWFPVWAGNAEPSEREGEKRKFLFFFFLRMETDGKLCLRVRDGGKGMRDEIWKINFLI